MSVEIFSEADDKLIIEKYAKHGSVLISSMTGYTTDQIIGRVAVLRKRGHDIKTPPKAQPSEREVIRDGYDDVPYWCRLSTRPQSCVEPKFDGTLNRHVAVRFEYDEDARLSKWFNGLHEQSRYDRMAQ